jgi:transposase InsO family protein
VARNVREWLGRIGVRTLFIEPGSPWENGYCESFNSKLRDELLAGEQFSRCTRPRSCLQESWRAALTAPLVGGSPPRRPLLKLPFSCALASVARLRRGGGAVFVLSTRWVRILIKRYNEGGPHRLGDQRAHNGTEPTILTQAALAALKERLASPPDDGGLSS